MTRTKEGRYEETGIVILTIALIAAICGSFYVVNDKSKRANQKEKVLTEVQRITTKDLDKNYPQTPREVVKFYNRIVKCYYGMQYSDEELDVLTDQALKLFDDELAANNPRIPTNSLSRQMRKATRTRALHLLRLECVTAMM